MSLLLLSLALASAALPAEASAAAAPLGAAEDEASEIVVLGRKLKEVNIEFSARNRRGRVRVERCRVTRSSGDREVDAIGCAAVRGCASTNPGTREAFFACIDGRRDTLIASLAERRGLKR